MSCCGRGTIRRAGEPAPISASLRFIYSGPRTLVVRGPTTGREYRFAAGVAVRVHGRDAPAFAGIPGLRKEGQ